MVFLLSIFVIAQMIFFTSDFFALRTIEINGSDKISHEEIVQTAGFPLGNNILFLNSDLYRNKIGKILWIKDVHLEKIYPGGVRITVTERNPVISVSCQRDAGTRFAVDDEGVILSEVNKDKDKDLPNLQLPEEIKVGNRIDKSLIKTILTFFTWLSPDMAAQVTTFTIEKSSQISFYFLLNDHPVEVKIGDLQDVKQKIEILQKILDEMKGKSQQLVYIDLRYKEPVVRMNDRKDDTPENNGEEKKEGE